MSVYISTPYPTMPRYIPAFGGWSPLVDAARSNGTIFLRAFDIETACSVDAVCFITGAVQTGTVVVGIYRGVTDDTATGATLVGSTTAPSVGSYGQSIATFSSPLMLSPGRYYVALQNELSADTIVANSSWLTAPGGSMSVSRAYDGTLPATLGTASNNATPLSVAIRRA